VKPKLILADVRRATVRFCTMSRDLTAIAVSRRRRETTPAPSNPCDDGSRDPRDTGFVALVERPLFDPFGRQQSSLRQDLEVLTYCRLGHPELIEAGGLAADSLAPRRVRDRVFPIAKSHALSVVLVADDAIAKTQRLLWQVLRVVAEPGRGIAYGILESFPLLGFAPICLSSGCPKNRIENKAESKWERWVVRPPLASAGNGRGA
jgi:hypothetical protein